MKTKLFPYVLLLGLIFNKMLIANVEILMRSDELMAILLPTLVLKIILQGGNIGQL